MEKRVVNISDKQKETSNKRTAPTTAVLSNYAEIYYI